MVWGATRQGEFICFKCRDFGHVSSKCPNKKIDTLVEENEDFYDEYRKEDNVVEEVEFINKLPSIEQFVFEEILFVIDD